MSLVFIFIDSLIHLFILYIFVCLFITDTAGSNSSQRRHNGRDGVSNHQPHNCLLNRLFRRRSKKKNQSSASLAFVQGIHRWRGIPHTNGHWRRKVFPFDDVIIHRKAISVALQHVCYWLAGGNAYHISRELNAPCKVFMISITVVCK